MATRAQNRPTHQSKASRDQNIETERQNRGALPPGGRRGRIVSVTGRLLHTEPARSCFADGKTKKDLALSSEVANYG
jgi:hypothetical protein